MLEVPDLSIIIINWNSAEFVKKCLASVYANVENLRFEVIVVDNASFDDCEKMLEDEFSDVKFIQSSKNMGFAGANNLAFKSSCGRNILFLNPDTEIVGPAIQQMVAFLENTPQAGIVGCKLLNSDYSKQTSCIQPFPSILNQAFDSEFLATVFPNASIWGRRPLQENDDRPAVVEVISGACLGIKRDTFENIGLFTPDYFMYAEDCDLCYKAKQAGWQAYYLSRATVIHYSGRSSDLKPESNFASVMMRQSLLKFMRARRGKVYAAAYRATIALVSLCRLLLLGVLMAFAKGRPQHQTISRAFNKWGKVFGWATGWEAWLPIRK
jgi:GT2 family glycosyltransferase